jgi:hypothetical protein
MDKKINAYGILMGNPDRDYLEDLGEDGMMILNGVYRNRMGDFGLVHLD